MKEFLLLLCLHVQLLLYLLNCLSHAVSFHSLVLPVLLPILPGCSGKELCGAELRTRVEPQQEYKIL